MPAGFTGTDRTVHTSYEWLDAVAARLGGERRDAYHALHAVLGALRDRLPVDIAMELSEQMPLLVRGIFFDGYEPAHRPLRAAGAADFRFAVKRGLAAVPGIDAVHAIGAVADVLIDNVDDDVLAHVRPLLPPAVHRDVSVAA